MAKKTLSREELAKILFDEYAKDGEPITMEEALECADMEIRAGNISSYVVSEEKTEKKERKPREIKISDVKKSIYSTILNSLSENDNICDENIRIVVENKLIQIDLGDKWFTIDLIEHKNRKSFETRANRKN